jgi:hypothetical protein
LILLYKDPFFNQHIPNHLKVRLLRFDFNLLFSTKTPIAL